MYAPQVLESWRRILANIKPRAFKVGLQDVRVYAADAQGYVTCVELIDTDDSKGRWVLEGVGRA